MNVTKRNGKTEKIDLEKIHKVVEWAAEGLDVSVSQVELDAQIQFYEGIKTKDIHNTLIRAAADLISEETPDYQYLSARLAMFAIRKEAYGQYTPRKLAEQLEWGVDQYLYDTGLLKSYTAEEIAIIDSFVDHERDMNYAYAGIEQLRSKYLVQDRVTKQVYESPQTALILISMAIFSEKYKGKQRLNLVRDLYNELSTFKVSLPTPIMAGVRTPSRQFSSCVLIECGDSLDSIKASSNAIVDYISRKAGIGLNVGRIRAEGSPIRNGEARHTGVLPFLKLFQASVKSCSQGGVRGGAATLFYPVWHKEFESLIVLKNNRGVEENRVRQLDYCVQLSGYFYEKLIKGEDIHFFSPHEVPGMYEAYFADQAKFKELYEAAITDSTPKLKASEVFSRILQERAGTGRIYIQNADHCNTHSPFDPKVSPIRQSNLCVEVALPTEPVTTAGEGEIALCTLAAVNLGAVETDAEIAKATEMLVRALDALLDYQEYPLAQAVVSTEKYRPLGVGVVNYATFLAKRGHTFSGSEGNNDTHKLFESLQYHLMLASVKLAKEFGPCEAWNTLRRANKLPIHTYKKEVDAVHTQPLIQDWDLLSHLISEYGMRNATVSALMPSETSSQISNATNGIEPPRALVTSKQSKDGILKQVVPMLGEVQYETYWEMIKAGQEGNLEKIGIMQKFVDQTISANTGYDPNMYEGGRIPMQQMMKDLITAYRLGIKTLYYHNTRDSIDSDEDDSCDSGACKI
jgi:ribonucleoside-diphosphate reductase alpha chain